ncbi:MAG: hypothetical protein K2M98_08805, partial [Muribaculum sp.]|nr:hypothetical protein [Muribaculum sp.]
MKTKYISLVALALWSVAGAQNLSKEIVVDKDIILEQRDVAPLSVQPQLVVDRLSPVTLPWSQTGVAADPTVSIVALPPVAWRLTVDQSPWRGYVRGGYFPGFQADLSAGYRVISRENMRLDLWGQYSGLSYKNKIATEKFSLRNNDITVGSAFRWSPKTGATLSAAIDYLGALYTMPRYSVAEDITDYSFTQKISDFNARIGWQQNVGSVDYSAHLRVGHFEFGHGAFYGAEHLSDRYKALYQTTLAAGADVTKSFSASFAARLVLNYDAMYNPAGYMLGYDGRGIWRDASDYGVFTIAPAVDWRRKDFRIHLGLKAYARTGEVSKFNIYPDVRVDWLPSQQFSIYAAVGGGRVLLNTMSQLFGRSRYLNPSGIYSPASEKMHFDAGMTVGPFRGFSIEITASASKWSRLIMPLAGGMMSIGTYMPTSLKSVTGRVAIRYEYADMLKLRVGYTAAVRGRNNGCDLWLDRASGVFDSKIEFTPIQKLTVGCGYGMRVGRHIYDMDGNQFSLGVARDLNIGAMYRVSDRLAVEVEAHNLTASRWMVAWGVRNPG